MKKRTAQLLLALVSGGVAGALTLSGCSGTNTVSNSNLGASPAGGSSGNAAARPNGVGTGGDATAGSSVMGGVDPTTGPNVGIGGAVSTEPNLGTGGAVITGPNVGGGGNASGQGGVAGGSGCYGTAPACRGTDPSRCCENDPYGQATCENGAWICRLYPAQGVAAPGCNGKSCLLETGGSNSGGAPSHGIPACESPTIADQLVVCSNGFTHRAQPSVCESVTGAAGADGESANAGGAGGIYAGCVDDSDCAPGTACLCDAAKYSGYDGLKLSNGLCVPATCRTDADCGVSSFCAMGNLNYSGDAVAGFSCLSADDECTTDRDCALSGKWLCLQEAHRVCSSPPE